MFYEIVIAPSYTPEGLEVLKGKSKNLRIVEAKPRAPSGLSLRQVRGRDGRVCVGRDAVCQEICVRLGLADCGLHLHINEIHSSNVHSTSSTRLLVFQTLTLCPIIDQGKCAASVILTDRTSSGSTGF